MREQSEVMIRKLVERVNKDEVVDVLLLIVSLGPGNRDLMLDKAKDMSMDAQALLVVVILEMLMAEAEMRGFKKGKGGERV